MKFLSKTTKNTFAKLALVAMCLLTPLHIDAQGKTHVVQAGETVYGIARKYGVAPNDILRLNKSLGDGEKIMIGQRLVLPENANVNAQPAPVAQSNAAVPSQQSSTTTSAQGVLPQNPMTAAYKELYRIEKKDNLYKVAAQFNLTVEELVEANPPLTVDSKLKKGEFLYIPYSRAEKQAEADRIAAEQEAARKLAEEQAKRKTINHLHVGVLLPLKEGGDRGNKMIEFYQGLLMAADSVKGKGVVIDLHAIHSGNTLADINYVLAKPELQNMDVIFGPLDAVQAGPLSDFAQQNKIRLVMPFATTNNQGLNNPYVYHASVAANSARQTAADFALSRFKNANYIILKTGAADSRGNGFVEEMRSQISARGGSLRTLVMGSDDTAYAEVMMTTRQNIIIPDASSLTATTSLCKKLTAYVKSHPEYHISLLGYPEWPTYVSKLLNDFYALDTYAYCTFYRNPTEGRVTTFENNFKRHFKKNMALTYPRYGMMGFDLGYYFMTGLAKLGDYFDEKQDYMRMTPFQNGLRFLQNGEGTAHVNQMVSLVHYTVTKRVEVISQ